MYILYHFIPCGSRREEFASGSAWKWLIIRILSRECVSNASPLAFNPSLPHPLCFSLNPPRERCALMTEGMPGRVGVILSLSVGTGALQATSMTDAGAVTALLRAS